MMNEHNSQGDPLAMAVVLADLKPGERVLDLSGRAGSIAFQVASTAASVEAVQPEEELAEEGRRLARALGRDNVFFHSSSLDRIPFDTGQFDLVFLCQALSREPRPLAAMREVRRVLHPEGRVVVQEIVAFDDPALDLRIWEMERRRIPGHLFFYGYDEVTALTASAGFVTDREQRSGLTQDFDYWAGATGASTGDAGADVVAESKSVFFSLSPSLQERLDLSLADGRISFTYPLLTLRARLG
ncbi:MAG: class I SAM-dependent methyltransferase [Thermoleophilia bacterium]